MRESNEQLLKDLEDIRYELDTFYRGSIDNYTLKIGSTKRVDVLLNAEKQLSID